jgi:CRISPR/Cas system CSM-associated protein Csm3 (group 7 of RAMP superfamily)
MLLKLKLSFLSYWHTGTGLGDGSGHDAAVLRDLHGLPYFPGKALRGILRNALEKAQTLGWFSDLDDNLTSQLFGSSHLNESQDRLTASGNVFVSSAELPDAERNFLKQPENRALKNSLFSTVASTAIDEKTGSAKPTSLRTTEVVVPLELEAEVELSNQLTPGQIQQSIQAIELALPLIEHIGAKRTRGLGKVAIKMEIYNAG